MNKKHIKFGLVAVLLVASAVGFSMMLNDSSQSPTGTAMMDINIQFEDGIDNQFLERINAEVNNRLDSINTISAHVPLNMLDAIKDSSLVENWEYNMPMQMFETDSMDWGVDRVDADIAWGGSDGALDVSTSTCGDTIKLAVIDTGSDVDHPDLNIQGGYDFVNDDSDPDDDHYHGTHVAGTVAALDDEPNALSGSLIGNAPCVELYAVKVLDSQGSGTAADVAAGIEWAADNGMDIASLSLGGSYSSTIDQAGQYAYNNGVLLIAASGNDGASSVGYPAANEEFMAVGATDQNDAVADFSNYGPALEITAPGVDIMSTTPTDLSGGGPFSPSANYDTLSGTSMATPHVSGVAATAWSGDTSLTNVEMRDILTSTAEDVNGDGYDEKYGYGIVDAEAATNAVTGGSGGGSDDTQAPSQVTGLTATAVSSSQIDLSWDAASDDTGVDHYNIYRDGTQVAETSSTSYSDTGLSADTTYTYEVSAEDAAGNEGALSDPASATTDSSSTSDTMHVSDVTVTNPRNRGPWRDIQVAATIVDSNGNAVSGATVSIQLDTPSNTYTASAETDSNGNVAIYFEKADRTSGTYTGTVTDVTASGYTYDSASNVETSDSITA